MRKFFSKYDGNKEDLRNYFLRNGKKFQKYFVKKFEKNER